jgi:hypothetical protein
VKTVNEVPATLPITRWVLLAWRIAAGAWQVIVLTDSQAVVAHTRDAVVCWITRLGEKFAVANPIPSTVNMAVPLVGALDERENDNTGESYVYTPLLVPSTDSTSTCKLRYAPTP